MREPYSGLEPFDPSKVTRVVKVCAGKATAAVTQIRKAIQDFLNRLCSRTSHLGALRRCESEHSVFVTPPPGIYSARNFRKSRFDEHRLRKSATPGRSACNARCLDFRISCSLD